MSHQIQGGDARALVHALGAAMAGHTASERQIVEHGDASRRRAMLESVFTVENGFRSAIAGVGIGPFVAGFKLVPQSRDPRPGAFDPRGAGLSNATPVALVYGIIEPTPRAAFDPLRPPGNQPITL